MMDKYTYEKKLLIRSEQVDMNRKLRMSELFRLMEEASIAHTEELGCTRKKTLDRGLLWVILRQQAEIDDMPGYDEEITVRSWQGDMMHVLFPRFYEIERAGKVIVRGQAMWMLIDEDERQMVMPEEYDIFIPGRPGSDDMMLPPVVIPQELKAAAPVMKEELRARFTQIDINGHMNNTRYFDILDDAVYAYLEGAGRVSGDDASCMAGPHLVRADYLREIRAGETFTLTGWSDAEDSMCSAGNRLCFEGADEDEVKFRVALEY